jgi:hypothetical protein
MAEPALMRFADTDDFLRRVRFYDHIKVDRDEIRWNAFKDRDVRMSFTYRDGSLQSDEDIDKYHAYFSKLVGETLPAILWFTFDGLTRRIVPPLEPQLDPDPDDTTYGHLHCSTDAPRDKPHMELMAKLVNDGQFAGIARRYPKPLS